jgi:hypothetical protein
MFIPSSHTIESVTPFNSNPPRSTCAHNGCRHPSRCLVLYAILGLASVWIGSCTLFLPFVCGVLFGVRFLVNGIGILLRTPGVLLLLIVNPATVVVLSVWGFLLARFVALVVGILSYWVIAPVGFGLATTAVVQFCANPWRVMLRESLRLNVATTYIAVALCRATLWCLKATLRCSIIHFKRLVAMIVLTQTYSSVGGWFHLHATMPTVSKHQHDYGFALATANVIGTDLMRQYSRTFTIKECHDVHDVSSRGGAYENDIYIPEGKDVCGSTALIKAEVYHVNVEALQEASPRLLEAVDPEMRALCTNGDGACGLHAFFGKPVQTHAGGYELFAPGCRAVAAAHLGQPLEELEMRADISNCVHAIKTNFWDEFVVPYLNGDRTYESDSFWACLDRINPDLAQEATTVYNGNKARGNLHDAAKERVLVSSRQFFQSDIEENVIRPLAVQLGYIPTGCNPLAPNELESARLAPDADENEFLKEASIFEGGVLKVKGTQRPWPTIGPPSKYAALFDDRSEFDSLRFSFLVHGDGQQTIASFVMNLRGIIHDALGNLSQENLGHSCSFLQLAVNWQNTASPTQEPPDFARRAWSAYAKCVQNPLYYFSPQE